jgi:hypothetical protein
VNAMETLHIGRASVPGSHPRSSLRNISYYALLRYKLLPIILIDSFIICGQSRSGRCELIPLVQVIQREVENELRLRTGSQLATRSRCHSGRISERAPALP